MQVAKCPARVEQLKNETWSPEIIFIAGDHVPKPEKSRTQLAQRSAPTGIGHTRPHQAKTVGLISANAPNRPTIFQLATQMETNPDAEQNRGRWVWVKPTKKQTNFYDATS